MPSRTKRSNISITMFRNAFESLNMHMGLNENGLAVLSNWLATPHSNPLGLLIRFARAFRTTKKVFTNCRQCGRPQPDTVIFLHRKYFKTRWFKDLLSSFDHLFSVLCHFENVVHQRFAVFSCVCFVTQQKFDDGDQTWHLHYREGTRPTGKLLSWNKLRCSL